MKVGDLVRHKRVGKLALIIRHKSVGKLAYPYKLDVSFGSHAISKMYQFPELMWLDTGEIDSCTRDHLELVNEGQ